MRCGSIGLVERVGQNHHRVVQALVQLITGGDGAEGKSFAGSIQWQHTMVGVDQPTQIVSAIQQDATAERNSGEPSIGG